MEGDVGRPCKSDYKDLSSRHKQEMYFRTGSVSVKRKPDSILA
jgi:hypothetical protein